jgi:lysyl-tRNA synthetase class 2
VPVQEVVSSEFAYTAKIDLLKKRAEIVKKIRAFFDARQVMEVETPLLAEAPVTDPHIEAIQTIGVEGYLQTSPEYAMKRLLAMGIGSCFQICKAFRVDPHSRIHHPEFTLLEWYRLDFDDHALMDETDTLLQEILACPAGIRISYEEAFLRFLKVSALFSSREELKALFIEKFGPIPGSEHFSIDDWRMLLFTHGIEPYLTGDSPYFIYDFPASQAALARLKNRSSEQFAFAGQEPGSTERKTGVNTPVNEDLSTALTPLFSAQVEFPKRSIEPSPEFAFAGQEPGSTERKTGVNTPVNEDLSTALTPLFSAQVEFPRGSNVSVAARFEVYMKGIELANGYHELIDAKGQAARFESDLQERKRLGKAAVPVDTRLLGALNHGLPDCAGIALGVDRLIMLALDAPRIENIAVLH